MPFVLLFWWSCPLCCVSFPLGAVVGNGPLMLVTAIGVCLLGCFGVFVFFPRVVALAFVLWRLSFCALGLLLSLIQLPSAASAHGLCCVLRFRSSSSSSSSSFFLFLFPFLPLLGLLLWLSVFSVVSFLLPLPGIAWCLAFPCPWFGRPLLTSFNCCSCFVLICVGFLAVVAVLAVVVVVGVCSPLVYGQRLFAGVAVVGVCSPLVLVWLVGDGVCSPLV